MLPHASHDTSRDSDSHAPATTAESARQRAIREIERRRSFWIKAAMGTAAMILLAAIWAISEYHNADGWPTGGFSESSGIPGVWNYWIIYPFAAWVVLTVAGGLSVYLRKPIPESKIQREIERQRH